MTVDDGGSRGKWDNPLTAVCCRKCHKAARPAKQTLEEKIAYQRFIICTTCGNKRCPKATDHDLECSGSNEPGQKGSYYE